MERLEGAAAYVIGRVRPEAVTLGNQGLAVGVRAARSQGLPKGVSQTPGALPALHSSFRGNGKKGRRLARSRKEYGR